ncbi:MAG: hypothetical protein KDD53_09195, partial [Bdellovibrionales bacterium]|nr:hypothetical protein [Bdellovibrionales bacterium]
MKLKTRVSIVVPVYGAFDEAKLCIERVLRFAPADASVRVIDDCSPEGIFEMWLPGSIRNDNRVVFSRN